MARMKRTTRLVRIVDETPPSVRRSGRNRGVDQPPESMQNPNTAPPVRRPAKKSASKGQSSGADTQPEASIDDPSIVAGSSSKETGDDSIVGKNSETTVDTSKAIEVQDDVELRLAIQPYSDPLRAYARKGKAKVLPTLKIPGVNTEISLAFNPQDFDWAAALAAYNSNSKSAEVRATALELEKSPISSTFVDMRFFRRNEFDWSFGPLHTTTDISSTSFKNTVVEESAEIIMEKEPVRESPKKKMGPTVESSLDFDFENMDEIVWIHKSLKQTTGISDNTSAENVVISMDETAEAHQSPIRDIPSPFRDLSSSPRDIPNLNETIWTDEDEPLIERVEVGKRKYLGKRHATRTLGTEPISKKSKRFIDRGEPSRTEPLVTDSPAAASVQHELSLEQERRETGVAEFVRRPNRPHRGFSSSAAAKMWPKFQSRIGLPDKGFDEQSIREFHFIKQVVETQGLQKLCEIHKSYNLTLIREFYCEVATNSSSRLTIRGTPVHLTAKRINTFLSLSPPAHTEFKRMLKTATPENLYEVAAALGKPRSTWSYHSNVMLRTFKASSLSADANVWINLVRHSISPTTHDSTISVERMFLLYCVMTGRTVNIGKLILRSIRECSSRTKGKFYFPGMLTKMLVEMGVPQYEDDLLVREQREKAEIDMRAVQRLRDRREMGVGTQDLVVMMQDLVGQNSTLLDTILKQREEMKEKLEELRFEVKAMAEERRRRDRDSAGARLPKMRRLLKAKNLEIGKLQDSNKKLRAMIAARFGAAASHGVAAGGSTVSGQKQPTPAE